MKYTQCEWCLRNVGAINIWANLGLAVIKVVGGILAMSRALLADAVHSVSDVAVAVALLVTLKVSAKPPDRSHPYGHGNIEFITSGLIGVFLIGIGIFICIFALKAMTAGNLPQTGTIGILAAIVSIGGNELLARHSFCLARETGSPAIFANAVENRADVYSSIAALVGIAGARFGFRFLDPLAAVFVGVLIGKFAISTLNQAIHGLLGGSIGRVELERINRIAASVGGVEEIYSIKARKAGQKTLIDLEIGFGAETKLEEGTRISESIKSRILRQINYVGDVSVYFK